MSIVLAVQAGSASAHLQRLCPCIIRVLCASLCA